MTLIMKTLARSTPPFSGQAKFQEEFAAQPGVNAGEHSAIATSFFHQNPFVPHKTMPVKKARSRARVAKRAGKKPTTQAGAFVREEMRALKRGSGNVRSRKQAIAIGLSQARRAGVKLETPAKGKASTATRKKARRDSNIGAGRAKPSPARSRGAKKAARTRARRYSRR